MLGSITDSTEKEVSKIGRLTTLIQFIKQDGSEVESTINICGLSKFTPIVSDVLIPGSTKYVVDSRIH